MDAQVRTDVIVVTGMTVAVASVTIVAEVADVDASTAIVMIAVVVAVDGLIVTAVAVVVDDGKTAVVGDVENSSAMTGSAEATASNPLS